MLYEQFKSIVNITDHVDIQDTTERIKKAIDFKGPNAWILAFAVIVASVGLNVNSVPVIIGAMLISPLMGPIIGAGLAVGVNDSDLLRRSLKYLAVMVSISIIASTAYFLVSPLDLAEPTELLARTRPTIYDVFIAFFGGLAGIVENSRKDKGTAIAGVAIATALMPPLCTAGYGLATGNISFFAGAMYLFTINSIFIALATYVIVRYLKFPNAKFADPAKQKRVRRNIGIFTLLLIIPSIYTAVIVIQENSFNQSVKKFIYENKTMANGYIYDYNINHKQKPSHLEIAIAGERLSDSQKDILFANLERHGIMRGQVTIKHSSVYDQSAYGIEIVHNILNRGELEVLKRDEIISNLRKELDSLKTIQIPYEQISKEIIAQYPEIKSLSITKGSEISVAPYATTDQIIVLIENEDHINDYQIEKLRQWLIVRLNFNNIRIHQIK